MSLIEFETTVKGGLPVIARVACYPPEPDVGIFTRQCEIDDILWPSGKPITQKVFDSIPASDIEDILERAREYD